MNNTNKNRIKALAQAVIETVIIVALSITLFNLVSQINFEIGTTTISKHENHKSTQRDTLYIKVP